MPRGVYPRTEYHRKINSEGQKRKNALLTPKERSEKLGCWKDKHTKGSEAMQDWWTELRKDPIRYKNWLKDRANTGSRCSGSSSRSDKAKERNSRLTIEERKKFGHPGHYHGFWETRTCSTCGKIFEVRKKIKKVCCSHECAFLHRKNRPEGYSRYNAMDIPEYRAKAIYNRIQVQRFSDKRKELKLLPLLLPFGFRYTGDGSLWVDRLNPDYANEEKKLAIEFAGIYWHPSSYEIERPKKFKEASWRCLVIWETELEKPEKELLEKITNWIHMN